MILFSCLTTVSSGHAKRRNNGLDADKNNVKQGGVRQHPTYIANADYLGQFHDVNNRKMVQVTLTLTKEQRVKTEMACGFLFQSRRARLHMNQRPSPEPPLLMQ